MSAEMVVSEYLKRIWIIRIIWPQ